MPKLKPTALPQVTAYSPTGRPLGCPVSEDNGTFYASFNPDEAGEWKIHVTYDDEDIENSPFRCMVFDPRAINVSIAAQISDKSALLFEIWLRFEVWSVQRKCQFFGQRNVDDLIA